MNHYHKRKPDGTDQTASNRKISVFKEVSSICNRYYSRASENYKAKILVKFIKDGVSGFSGNDAFKEEIFRFGQETFPT